MNPGASPAQGSAASGGEFNTLEIKNQNK